MTIDQRLPFQCSIRVRAVRFTPYSAEPVAKQLVVVGHDTPPKKGSTAPAGFGLVIIDQRLPSQCEITVWDVRAKAIPTAKQLAALGQDTALRPASASVGVDTIDHDGVAFAAEATVASPLNTGAVDTTTATTGAARSPREDAHRPRPPYCKALRPPPIVPRRYGRANSIVKRTTSKLSKPSTQDATPLFTSFTDGVEVSLGGWCRSRLRSGVRVGCKTASRSSAGTSHVPTTLSPGVGRLVSIAGSSIRIRRELSRFGDITGSCGSPA